MSAAAARASSVRSARSMDAVHHWEALADSLAPHLKRCRMLDRPCSVLRIRAVPITPLDGPLSAASCDALVQACAFRLRAAIRATDRMARVGTGGIAVLLDGASSPAARLAAERLLRLCQSPYRIGGQSLDLSLQVEFDDT